MPVIEVGKSTEEYKSLSNDELTALQISNNGAIHALEFMREHGVSADEMLSQLEDSQNALRPIAKERDCLLTYELDITPNPIIDLCATCDGRGCPVCVP